MMATVDRNRPLTVWTLFFSHLRQLEGRGADNRAVIRKVAEGEVGPDSYQLPFISAKLTELKPVGRVESDKQIQGKIKIKITTAIPTANDGTAEILSKISQVDNHLEAFKVPAGANGFELAQWGTTYSMSAEHGNSIAAECELSFSVIVSRGSN
jgi:hypothetical protein